MNNRSVVFHVGLPKSASTWLQSVAFPNIKSVNYIGRNYNLNQYDVSQGKPPKIKDDVYDALFHLSKAHPHSYNKRWVKEVIDSKLVDDLPNIISTEHLSEVSNYLQASIRIKELYPECSIILSIRNQASLLLSIYLNELSKGCIENFTTLLNYDHENRQRIIGIKEIWLDHYDFFQMYNNYSYYFGKDNILVLPVELIKKDVALYGRKLFSFLGIEYEQTWVEKIKSNEKVNKGGVQIDDINGWLFLNRLGYFFPERIRNGINNRIEIFIKATRLLWRINSPRNKIYSELDKIGEKFSESNKLISDEIGIDLNKLGYRLK